MLVPFPQLMGSCGSGFCCNNNSNAPIQLAAISLQTFSGITQNDRISDIQRVFHLSASLCYRVKRLKSYKAYKHRANYIIAWESLIGRYNNKKVLIQSHTRGLYELSVITEESKQLGKLIFNNILIKIEAILNYRLFLVTA
ncbi:unnamed protein product [Macrosiphum euphorbiae]|uniref:Uncharacterized protein n=1 Tax=Macrosiphum euphorbiae TaxID=13131 RepID=A0AAV0W2B9_9HEMI|nr:unnamed protein product [Macrosiphum euphorbiae]